MNDAGTGLARVQRYLNDSMHGVDSSFDWPYKVATTTGTAPLTITDLQTIETITDIGSLNVLKPRDRRDLRQEFADLTQTGRPLYYYLVNNVINVFYANTSTVLTVDYQKVAPDMVSGSDTPLMPDRYRYCLVEYTVSRLFRDEDAVPESQAAQQAGDSIVAQMTYDLMKQQHQESQDIQWLDGSDS